MVNTIKYDNGVVVINDRIDLNCDVETWQKCQQIRSEFLVKFRIIAYFYAAIAALIVIAAFWLDTPPVMLLIVLPAWMYVSVRRKMEDVEPEINKKMALILFQRQVKNIYIFSTSQDDRNVLASVEQAKYLLHNSGNTSRVAIVWAMYQDVKYSEYTTTDGTVYTQTDTLRDEKTYPASEGFDDFLDFCYDLKRKKQEHRARVFTTKKEETKEWYNVHYMGQVKL